MDIRKHMLAYFERTCLANKQLAGIDLTPISKSKPKRVQALDQNSHKITQHLKGTNSGSLTTKSDSIRRSISSRGSSNKSSRLNSPSLYTPRLIKQSTFRDSFLKTINELTKVRSLKISKQVEFVAKEVRLIKKLKSLVMDEIKISKKQDQRTAIEDVNEKLSIIMKQSAEELLILEGQIKGIIEENLELQKNLEALIEKNNALEAQKKNKKKVVKKILSIEECLDELTRMDQDSSTMLVGESERVKNYLSSVEVMAEELIKNLSVKDPKALPGVLALQLSREKMLFEQRKKQNQDSLEHQKKQRKKLEKKIKSLKKHQKHSNAKV